MKKDNNENIEFINNICSECSYFSNGCHYAFKCLKWKVAIAKLQARIIAKELKDIFKK